MFDLNPEYVKFKNGPVTGVFAGKPIYYRSHSVNKAEILCPDDETCMYCKAGNAAGRKFKVNFLVMENGMLQTKVFSSSYTTSQTLATFNKKHPLAETIVKITRNGEGMNT